MRTLLQWLQNEGLFGWNWLYLITHPWLIFKEIYYHTKWFLQRGKRGYSDLDSWGLDHYLNSWLPQAIRELKVGFGYPMQIYIEMFPDDNFETLDEVHSALVHARWHEILDTIALGFEAGRRINELEFEGNEWQQLEQQLNEGLRLFSKYYLNLWS